MPPKKKTKVITYDQLRADIESSQLSAEEYSELIELCREKEESLKEDDSIALIKDIVGKYLAKFQEMLKECEEEEVDQEDEEAVSEHNSTLERVKRGKKFFDEVEVIDIEHEKHVLRYDKHEGEMAVRYEMSFRLKYEGITVTFKRVVHQSSYGGDNDQNCEIEGYTSKRLEETWHLDDLEEIYEFFSECFDDIANEQSYDCRETEFYGELRERRRY